MSYESDLKKPLTPLERRFVMEMIKDGNGAEALDRAGSDGNKRNLKRMAWVIFNRPHVRKAYEELERRMIDKALITRESLLNDLQDTIMEARKAGKFEAAMKGYEHIGKIIGALKTEKTSKSLTADEASPVEDATEAFNQGEDDFDIGDDIQKFLKLAESSNKKQKQA